MESHIYRFLLHACGELMIKNKLSIAFAESATAGRITAEFAMIPDAGKFLKGGIICYDAAIKHSLLKVPEQQLETFSPESEIVTLSITAGLQRLIPATIHVGCTGLTAPGGSETKEKPVGTMFLYGISGHELIFSERTVYQGSPQDIVEQTVMRVAQLLHAYLLDKE
nr:CinA family protein [Pedobacter panaciterrae]